MCGIAGIVSREGITESDRAAVPRLLELLRHRGPDDAGIYCDRHAVVGHRRLSIIDLTTGRQPIGNEDGTIQAVVNGEFYDFSAVRDVLLARGHVFRSTGDSECLVHLYEDHGLEGLSRLSGMFAFALWDAPRRLLWAARDRLGVKPFYYHCGGERLVFGSELKAVAAAPGVPSRPDLTAVADFLTFGFVPSPKSILHGVRKLPPGHMLIWQDGRAAVRPYWDLEYRGWSGEPPEQLAERIWDAVRRGTRSRMVADVPVGGFLSSGVDSASVVAAMTQSATGPVVTVTCGFEERGFDERRAAAATARRLGTLHREEVVTPDAAGLPEELARYFDEPFADASAIPMYYLSRAARRQVTVALSGDGGDEALAGYRRYRFDQIEERVRQVVPDRWRAAMLRPIGRRYPSRPWMPQWLRAGATLRNLATDGASGHGQSIATMSGEEREAMLTAEVRRELGGYDPLEVVRELYRRCDAPDHLSKCQYVDLRLGLADGILTKVDRASMAHALEVRSPMLDYRFVEHAWSIPPEWRMRGRFGKYPLRLAVARHVGEEWAWRRKRGFEVPLDAWFDGPLRERFHDTLLRPGAAVHDWISADAIRRLWEVHRPRQRRCGPTLWKLVVLDTWCRVYGGRAMEMSGTSRPVATVAAGCGGEGVQRGPTEVGS